MVYIKPRVIVISSNKKVPAFAIGVSLLEADQKVGPIA